MMQGMGNRQASSTSWGLSKDRAKTTRNASKVKVLVRPKFVPVVMSIFDRAEESTLNDCFLARASWYRINAQGAYRRRHPLGEMSDSAKESSAFLAAAYFRRLQSVQSTCALPSTLLRESANFQKKFLDDLCSILLAGVTSYKAVGHFYHFFKMIPLHEYVPIGETLIETLKEILPHMAVESSILTTDRTMSATVTGVTGTETDWETYTPTHDSPQSMIQAWVRLYAKFRTHVLAVSKGRPQPPAHPSMQPSSQEETRARVTLEGISDNYNSGDDSPVPYSPSVPPSSRLRRWWAHLSARCAPAPVRRCSSFDTDTMP
ncbi:hypothetical protein B484DRAFT_477277 [Ochromonadaceae sp. CCMP2298]|nr:hypothetical protein B484DRAFT_477277 [Ochromonadaceae sp. CCMP2298]